MAEINPGTERGIDNAGGMQNVEIRAGIEIDKDENQIKLVNQRGEGGS